MQKQHKDTRRPEEASYVGRSRADRLLDGFYNSVKKRLNNTDTKVSLSNPSSWPAKRLKSENLQTQTDTKQSNTLPASSKPITSKSVNDALDEILNKHLKIRSKFAKSVKLVNSLIMSGYMDNSNSLTFLRIIYEIVLSDNCILEEEARKEVLNLFSTGVKQYINNQHLVKAPKNNTTQEAAESIYKNNVEDRISLLNLLEMRVTHLKLFTDDTYQFNQNINLIKSALSEASTNSNSLNDPDDSTLNNYEKTSNKPSVSDNWELPDISQRKYLKLRLLFESISTAYSFFFKYQWTQASVESLFQLAYQNRSIFSTSQQNQISTWQSSLKTSTHNRKQLNYHTLSIGESKNPIIDSRVQKITTIPGSAVWSAKQTGL